MRFWLRDPDTLEWAALEPASPMLALAPARPLTPIDDADGTLPHDVADLLLCRPGSATGHDLVLLSSPVSRTRQNGVPAAPTGIRCLYNKDALDVGLGSPIYISMARRPVVEPFPGADASVFCPRCQQIIQKGDPAVRCPGSCQSWYHQSEVQPCWDYADTCLLCPQPTSLVEDLRWTPHELASESHG